MIYLFLVPYNDIVKIALHISLNNYEQQCNGINIYDFDHDISTKFPSRLGVLKQYHVDDNI